MKIPLTCLSTRPMTAERTWTVEGVPALTAAVSLPDTAAEDRISRRIRRYSNRLNAITVPQFFSKR